MDKNGNSEMHKASSNNISKSEGKKTKSNNKKAQKTLIPLSGSIDINDLHELQPNDFQPGGRQGLYPSSQNFKSGSAKESGENQATAKDIDMKALEMHLNIKKP